MSSSSWQRQRDEPARAHARFEQYLALGPNRSLRALARTRGASYAYLKKLSCQWRWQARAANWQVNLQHAGPLDALDAAQEARARQIRDAQTLQQLARAQLARWIARDSAGGLRLCRRLSAHQVARVWQVGYRVEHELLPPPEPKPLTDAGRQLQKAKYQHEREQRAGPPEKWNLRVELAAFVQLLRKSRLSRGQVAQHHAKLLRWLWLPNEESLSLQALPKAHRKRSPRHHAHTEKKIHPSARA